MKVCFHGPKKGVDSLRLVILHQVCHVMQVRLQFDFFITQVVQMLSEVGDVGFKHHVDVGAGGGLFLQKFPLGLKHFVLLLQEPHLLGEKRRNAEMRTSSLIYIFILIYVWDNLLHKSNDR